MIETTDLAKRFGETWALRGVSFRVEAGEVVGYLGPNGAGKTTTLRLLLGLLAPTAGVARLFGLEAGKASATINRRIGAVPESGGLYQELTVRQNLRYFGELFGLSGKALERAMAEAMAAVDIEGRAEDRVRTLSKGLARRAALARALLHDPDLLILDEPTSGLDPEAQQHLRGLVKALRRRERTVLFSSHNLHEVEEVADRILILDHGSLVLDGPLEEILRHHARPRVDLELDREEEVAAVARWGEKLPFVQAVEANGRHLRVSLRSTADSAVFREALQERRIPFQSLNLGKPSLEEVYLELLGGQSAGHALAGGSHA